MRPNQRATRSAQRPPEVGQEDQPELRRTSRNRVQTKHFIAGADEEDLPALPIEDPEDNDLKGPPPNEIAPVVDALEKEEEEEQKPLTEIIQSSEVITLNESNSTRWRGFKQRHEFSEDNDAFAFLISNFRRTVPRSKSVKRARDR
jgi:hypothetical protein